MPIDQALWSSIQPETQTYTANTNISKISRLDRFGHVERKGSNDWVSSCRDFEVVDAKCRGRLKKTWGEVFDST